MQRWEYDFVAVPLVDYANEGRGARWRGRAEVGPYMGYLENAGHEGREAVAFVPAPDRIRGVEGWVLLKRPAE